MYKSLSPSVSLSHTHTHTHTHTRTHMLDVAVLTLKTQTLVWSLSLTLLFCGPMDCSPPRLLCPWAFPGKNTGVGCCALLQGIFFVSGSIGRRILYHCNTWVAKDANYLDENPHVRLFCF